MDIEPIIENILRDHPDLSDYDVELLRIIAPVIAIEWAFSSLIYIKSDQCVPRFRLPADLNRLTEKGILSVELNYKIYYRNLPGSLNPNKCKWAYKINPKYINGLQLSLKFK